MENDKVEEVLILDESVRKEKFDEIARRKGFKDSGELSCMVAKLDLTEPGKLEDFTRWKLEDGSKIGLERLLRVTARN
jgi:hypothetical protein